MPGTHRAGLVSRTFHHLSKEGHKGRRWAQVETPTLEDTCVVRASHFSCRMRYRATAGHQDRELCLPIEAPAFNLLNYQIFVVNGTTWQLGAL